MSSDERIWLVKSSARILGPYNFSEIAQLLKEKEVLVIDEVCEPQRRWQLIRDHEGFQSLIVGLNTEDVRHRDDITSSASITGSVTEGIQNPMSDEITEDISEYQSQLQEIVYDALPEIPQVTTSPHNLSSRFQVLGATSEKHIRSAADRSSRWMWGLTLLVLLGMSGFIGSKRFLKETKFRGPWVSKNHEVKDGVSEGLSLYQEGEYPKALEILSKIYENDNSQKKIILPLAMLFLYQEGQTVEARRLLQKIVDEKIESLAVAWTGMGLTYLRDGDILKAQESFRKALQDDPKFLPAQANLGVVALLQQEYSSAIDHLRGALDKGLYEGSVLLQFCVAAVNLWKPKVEVPSSGSDNLSLSSQSDLGNRLLEEASQRIQEYLKKRLDHQQELLLALTYLRFIQGLEIDFDSQFRKILDVDPQQTEDFIHPLYLSSDRSGWSQLYSWCQPMTEKNPELPSSVALNSYCLLKDKKLLAARTEMEKSINQAPRDPLLQAVYAGLLRSTGFAGEASVALGRAIELDRKNEYALPVLLQARFCQERGEQDCANTYWLRLLEHDAHQPSAKIGMASFYLARQAHEEAERFLQDVVKLAPNYKPLLRLQRAKK